MPERNCQQNTQESSHNTIFILPLTYLLWHCFGKQHRIVYSNAMYIHTRIAVATVAKVALNSIQFLGYERRTSTDIRYTQSTSTPRIVMSNKNDINRSSSSSNSNNTVFIPKHRKIRYFAQNYLELCRYRAGKRCIGGGWHQVFSIFRTLFTLNYHVQQKI